jgi:cupin fold WbuC family metalloprotein
MSIKLDDGFFEKMVLQAHESPRKRSHYNLHKELDESVQRLCIALVKGTYVRPHHHPQSKKWELVLALKGAIMQVIFDEAGVILEKNAMGPGEALSGVELKHNTWHTVYPLTSDAIFIEVKEGPYIPTQESDFASWAPAENDAQSIPFLNWLESAVVGQKYGA